MVDMERRRFGNSGLEVSPLGVGAAEIGYNGVDQEVTAAILNRALDLGINVIDTAECYRDSEEKIGAAVGHRRSEYLLFTKCGHSSGFEEPDWDPNMLRKQIDRSLQRLKTDHVDLLQLHSCSREVLEAGDVIEVLQEAKRSGKTRLIGYSGDGETAKYAVLTGQFDTLQTSCNIADQQCVALTLPLAREKGMGIIAKRPIANVAWKHESAEAAGYGGEYWRRLQSLGFQPGSDAVEFALRFTLAQCVDVAIVGASSPGRIDVNVAVVENESGAAAFQDRIADWRSKWVAESLPAWVGQQ